MNDGEAVKEKLLELARNLWWTWHPEAIDIWRTIDPELWRRCRHSPVAFVEQLGPGRLEEIARDPAHRIRFHRVVAALQRYLDCPGTWAASHAGPLRARPVAYFSAEFGIHESLPLYSGGLGVLAGDHLKSSSDLGVPMIGISLFYREGYFRQEIDDAGEQVALYERVNPEDLPLTRLTDTERSPITIEIPIQGDTVQIGVWAATLGRIKLFFLDTESLAGKEAIQELGLRLYGGDDAIRLAQEMVLGIGGMKLLHRLGIQPGVIHLNEGHCAFAPLEFARIMMEEDGIPFARAFMDAGARTVFTTHTPVPAGHDRFSSDLIGNMSWRYRETIGISHDEFMGLGRVNPKDGGEPFCMTVLALKSAGRSNGVSALHGRISREMWSGLWPGWSARQIPLGHITNGISVLGWLAPSMRQLFHRYFPPGWEDEISSEEIWRHIHSIPDVELWDTVLLLKTQLLDFLPRHPHRAHPTDLSGMDPHALTIGFARRFAGYKRPDLLLGDTERLRRILTNAARPVQFVFSGKAHPRDGFGKDLVRNVFRFVLDSGLNGKVVFIEDYDINVCRHLVQGVDVWLNTPRYGFEASGTSGMKVALNGGLNLSVLDGWWPEGYDGTNGFAVSGSKNDDNSVRDGHDREDVFRVLEEEVIPLYYDQDGDGIPRRWIGRMKQAMCTLGWRFSADRMVKDYTLHSYVQAAGISTARMHGPYA